MHIESEEIIKAKIRALRGRDAGNNKLVLETLALRGPLIKYDIFKALKSKGVKHYPTISRRVDALKDRGYLAVAGKRLIMVGKRSEESRTYALTWRGFIASLVIETVIKDIPSVLENDPLLEFPLPPEVPREMVISVLKQLFTPSEIRIIAHAILTGFLKALPEDIESISEEEYIMYMLPAFARTPEIKEKFEERDLTELLQIPGLLELALDLINTYEKQLSELLKGISAIKSELEQYVQS